MEGSSRFERPRANADTRGHDAGTTSGWEEGERGWWSGIGGFSTDAGMPAREVKATPGTQQHDRDSAPGPGGRQ